jgi:hypothetical protein
MVLVMVKKQGSQMEAKAKAKARGLPIKNRLKKESER